MTKRNYERLSIEEFGKHLLETNDLDPIYVALWNLKGEAWTIERVQRWLAAYWCFYHAGLACYLCQLEGADFWYEMKRAAINVDPAPSGTGDRWPRGKERRHFRGESCVRAVQELTNKYAKPEEFVRYVSGLGAMGFTPTRSYEYVAERTREHRLFGPWITFKVADMSERVLGVPVDFTQASVFMFKDPVKAALMLWDERCEKQEELGPIIPMAKAEDKTQQEIIDIVVAYLKEYFSDFKAPPSNNRPVGLQEVETILCKWKSHVNGHYPLYNDIDEIHDGLNPWVGFNQAAGQFMDAMPKRPREDD